MGCAATFCKRVQESNQLGPVWWKKRLKHRAPQASTRKVTKMPHRLVQELAPGSRNQIHWWLYVMLEKSEVGFKERKQRKLSQMIHVWYIYLHLGHLWGKCR